MGATKSLDTQCITTSREVHATTKSKKLSKAMYTATLLPTCNHLQITVSM